MCLADPGRAGEAMLDVVESEAWMGTKIGLSEPQQLQSFGLETWFWLPSGEQGRGSIAGCFFIKFAGLKHFPVVTLSELSRS